MNEEKEVVNLKELGEFGLIDRITKKIKSYHIRNYQTSTIVYSYTCCC